MKAIHARLERVDALLRRKRPPQGPQVIRIVGRLADGTTTPVSLLHVGGRTEEVPPRPDGERSGHGEG